LGTVVLVFVGCLLPFAAKPFHIDDPMYVWAAQHIAAHPWDFYGFVVNWDGTVTPMATVMKNPPFVSYYLAAVAQFVGWSEVALHAALFLPAVGVVLGTYSLSRQLTGRPGEATLTAALTPVLV
jgi:4-amino-4-deoxy-L-arabinose transferase-like glycosyltransferase